MVAPAGDRAVFVRDDVVRTATDGPPKTAGQDLIGHRPIERVVVTTTAGDRRSVTGSTVVTAAADGRQFAAGNIGLTASDGGFFSRSRIIAPAADRRITADEKIVISVPGLIAQTAPDVTVRIGYAITAATADGGAERARSHNIVRSASDDIWPAPRRLQTQRPFVVHAKVQRLAIQRAEKVVGGNAGVAGGLPKVANADSNRCVCQCDA